MLTLDQIKPEAERLFGAPLHLFMEPDRLVIEIPGGAHAVDMDKADLNNPLDQFSEGLLAPAMLLLHDNAYPRDDEAELAAALREEAAAKAAG